MKTVTVGSMPLEIDPEPHPMHLAQYLAGYLASKASGGVYGDWDDATRSGVWFYSKDGHAIFRRPTVDEILFKEPDRSRFRSVVFRLGSLASEEPGGLCGVMQILPEGADEKSPPVRRYFVHASFAPEAGLWFRATIVSHAESSTPLQATKPG